MAISLVVAANFAFDIANRKTLYDEYEDEVPEQDIWDRLDEEEEDIYDIDVDYEHVEAPEDWKVVDEEVIEPDDTPKGKVVDRILMKGPSKNRVLFTDGTEGFV